MLPLLTAPWALAILAALPALAVLYWLRNAWREVPVSSLMLWQHQSEAKLSGRRLRRLQTPLLFFLEIAALILLAFAAAGPRVDTAQGLWPLIVVLDDSFSMQAGGDDSARRLAQTALQTELRWGDGHPVRFILAGEVPQRLGDILGSWAEAEQALEAWRCRAPTASVPEAMALASELSGDKSRILVISDHKPLTEPRDGRVQWWSFGKPRPNVALVHASRTVHEGLDRCILEIANLADQAQTTELIVSGRDQLTIVQSEAHRHHRETLNLAAREVRRVSLRLTKTLEFVEAELSDDELPLDNQVTLLREETPPVRVLVQLKHEALRVPVSKALQATGRTAAPGTAPHLVITDDPDAQPAPADTWLVQLVAEKDGVPYVGPFVLDRSHPLTEGMHLTGMVWGAGPSRDAVGTPVILAGSVPLLTDAEDLAGRHHLRLRLRPDLSTLFDAPAWPILMSNLVQWRATALPGLRRANFRLGESVQVLTARGIDNVIYAPPFGPTRVVRVQHQRVTVRPEVAGMHEIDVGPVKHRFAVNALRPEESDVTKCAAGRVGEWSEDAVTAPPIYGLTWILLLIALGVLTLHMVTAVRAGK